MERNLKFSKNLYSIITLKKAAYRYINQFAVKFTEDEDSYFCCVKFSTDCSDDDAEKTLNDFMKEILDQDLREIIKRETEPTRNLILAHAFSKTQLIDSE